MTDWRGAHRDAVASGRRLRIKWALLSLGQDVKRVGALRGQALLAELVPLLARNGVTNVTVPEIVSCIAELVANLEAEAAELPSRPPHCI